MGKRGKGGRLGPRRKIVEMIQFNYTTGYRSNKVRLECGHIGLASGFVGQMANCSECLKERKD